MSVMAKDWAARILHGLGAPQVEGNIQVLVAWARGENTKARNNPLATTKKMPGSWDFNVNNGYPVQQYGDYLQGCDATVRTIRNGHYPTIVSGFRNGDPGEVMSAPMEFQVWGTGHANVSARLVTVKHGWPTSGLWVPLSLQNSSEPGGVPAVLPSPKPKPRGGFMYLVKRSDSAAVFLNTGSKLVPINNPHELVVTQSDLKRAGLSEAIVTFTVDKTCDVGSFIPKVGV